MLYFSLNVFSGNDDCSNTTGMFCQASYDTCNTFPACLIDDGSFPNSEKCGCGNNVCNPNEFCDAKQALLSTDNNPCYPLDCGMTPEDMLEQMPNCSRFNNRCECTKCKLGHYTEDCSEICPTPQEALLYDCTFFFVVFHLSLPYKYQR